MLRHLGLIAVCACIVASVTCGGGPVTAPAPTSPDPNTPVRVEFGGRVVNADAGGPVEGVRVSTYSYGGPGDLSFALLNANTKTTATSGGDGTFTLTLNLLTRWTGVNFQLTAPAGYENRYQEFDPNHASDRPQIRMYPTLVIRPGQSIQVHVDADTAIGVCDWGEEVGACRGVLVEASPGEPVELELVPDDSSNPMALSPDCCLEPDEMPVRRLMVPPGRVYVLGAGAARLTARR